MIDFRYHLVSLISVFLALAVGIVLGAGPLKEAIGDTLTGEVEQLRERAAELRSELDATSDELARAQEAFAAAAPDLVADVLGERRVAVVELGGVPGAERDGVLERLGQAGAVVTAHVRATDDWVDPGRRSYRQTLAGSLVEYLAQQPPEDAGADVELAEALAQALTTPSPEDPDLIDADAAVVLGLLVDGGMLETDEEVTVAADAVVVLAGSGVDMAEGAAGEEPTPEAGAALDSWVGVGTRLAVAAQARSLGAVVAGEATADDGLVPRLRADDETDELISTVGAVHTLVGQVSVPLALAERIAGEVGHYGPGPTASATLPPRVVLPPIVRAPAVVIPPLDGGTDVGAGDGETGDGGAGDEAGEDPAAGDEPGGEG